ncbi:MAG: RadC family protein [Clostridia bacterium]|nr:RadC family protein [Clostridia bacterium]
MDSIDKVSVPKRAHLGHRKRIRERYSRIGLASMDDKEILELLLTYAIPRRDVFDLAKNLLYEFGSLDRVLAASDAELQNSGLLTEHAATLIRLVNDLRTTPMRFINYKQEKLPSVKAAAEFCHSLLHGYPSETIMELLLDESGTVLDIIKVSNGDEDGAVLPIDSIIAYAKRSGYRRILIAHNHPSGNPAPSAADIRATALLETTLRSAGFELTEHMIVAKRGCTAVLHHQTIEIPEKTQFTPWNE